MTDNVIDLAIAEWHRRKDYARPSTYSLQALRQIVRAYAEAVGQEPDIDRLEALAISRAEARHLRTLLVA